MYYLIIFTYNFISVLIILIYYVVAVCPQGCYNGGSCVSPGRCSCAPGWSGDDCKTGICCSKIFRIRL